MVQLLKTFFKYNSSNLLPCVCFIRLRGQKRRVESEKGAMEQKSLRNTALYCTNISVLKSVYFYLFDS